MRLGAVLLAAGMSKRFGANKLLADYCGRPVLCAALDAMKALGAARMAAVVSCDETEALAKTSGCMVIRNDMPEMGQAHSIVLGVSAMRDMDAVLLLAADQPRLTGESLLRLAQAFEASGKEAACLRDETHMGNPAVFSAACFEELLALAGDRGAKGVLRAHEGSLLVVDCLYPHELADADTPQALCDIAALAQRKS